MTRINDFSRNEVIEYLEEKIMDNTTSDDEDDLYSQYKWTGKIDKTTYTWKNLIREMRDIYKNGYK